MRSISENHLAVLIPLLAAKIRDLRGEVNATDGRDDLSDDEAEDRWQAQDMLQQYDQILDTLREEYEAGLAEGLRLPSFADLTARFAD